MILFYVLGDDVTDENMFTSLPSHATTIKVGKKKTDAKYYIEDIEHVKSLLSILADVNDKDVALLEALRDSYIQIISTPGRNAI